ASFGQTPVGLSWRLHVIRKFDRFIYSALDFRFCLLYHMVQDLPTCVCMHKVRSNLLQPLRKLQPDPAPVNKDGLVRYLQQAIAAGKKLRAGEQDFIKCVAVSTKSKLQILRRTWTV